MANLNQPGVYVQVRIKTPDFSDALYYTLDEFEALKDSDLEAEKVARYNNWVAFVAEQSSKSSPEQSAEELSVEKEELEQKISAINAQLASIEKP